LGDGKHRWKEPEEQTVIPEEKRKIFGETKKEENQITAWSKDRTKRALRSCTLKPVTGLL
jgi:hypothetical protein